VFLALAGGLTALVAAYAVLARFDRIPGGAAGATPPPDRSPFRGRARSDRLVEAGCRPVETGGRLVGTGTPNGYRTCLGRPAPVGW
ncbi:hypothetical protein GJ633_12945, partial [Halorubrum sp. CBA1125]|uniref:hypothetical protein n=1 Tax=Halorubrum sp. CBA1125 TaxID=2668072 RepID=UPI00135EA5B0